MKRPTRDEVLMDSALIWSRRSTCSRLKVGAVFSREGRILVTGYNGSPAGLPHCDHTNDEPCTTAEHAERNGIAWAARHGVALEGCSLHVTHMPCLSCSMSIINAGVEAVHFGLAYRDQSGIKLLQSAGIVITSLMGVI